MDLGIRGRNAIINGGSAGLGFGTAMALGGEGVNLFISARNEARLQIACETIRSATGAHVQAIVADHATVEGRERILRACPQPDIFVGTCSPPPYIESFRDISDADWRANLDMTFISPVEFIRTVVDGMCERGWGRILNIATAAVKFPHPWRILSGAPRAALVNYTVAVARVIAPHGVTINSLLPAMHDTDGIREIYGKRAEENGISLEAELEEAIKTIGIPVGRFGSEIDFGAIAAMFCSQQSNYITGQSLVVDGGVTNATF
ncbi:SDR family oxidoreductase [Sphingobium sp. CR2-8]|uniref:SDR family oxidoreductase n=1 Tax=Sphingobium sp. CR2-8 TaxID=1306534 RepID=UPI002DB859D6|nr:SDR family oxidoreductase [Sphingobium sp. CR2-8]MEC3909105.1 SDR family oxidoreductase [Sphingobium sp. CR2-8]